MRVIQVANVRWFNATAWYGLELARLLRADGHESLVAGLAHSPVLEKAAALGLGASALPFNARSPLAWPGLFADMQRLVAAFRPDVVNCHRGEAFVLWAALRANLPRRLRFALIRTRGDQRLPKANLPNRLLHTRAADAVIATNSRMARHFAAMHVPPERLHTIYGGVDTRRFTYDPAARARVRTACGYADDDIVIGLLGRFDRVKGQKECIEAAARLIAGGVPVRLHLIGFATATSLTEVEDWIRAAGLDARHVRITGQVDDVAAHLAALDIGVVSSLWSETIARAALEIMACDRPLLSTSVGVMPDLLPTEALCPPGDVPALAALLRRAAESLAWREHLREVNRVRLPGLDSTAFLAQTLAVYQQACVTAGCTARL